MQNSAAPYIPPHPTLATLPQAAQACRGCDLYLHATQAVMGEGPASARIVLMGEQPGDQEDQQGRPFVGPAGRLLNQALEEAGIDRSQVYVTNSVKHFKFEERGKRRIHKKPSASEVQACQPWLQTELSLLKPSLVICLGATAAQSLLGKQFRLTQDRGRIFPHPWANRVLATIHPSALLRLRGSEERKQEFTHLVADLKAAASGNVFAPE